MSGLLPLLLSILLSNIYPNQDSSAFNCLLISFTAFIFGLLSCFIITRLPQKRSRLKIILYHIVFTGSLFGLAEAGLWPLLDSSSTLDLFYPMAFLMGSWSFIETKKATELFRKDHWLRTWHYQFLPRLRFALLPLFLAVIAIDLLQILGISTPENLQGLSGTEYESNRQNTIQMLIAVALLVGLILVIPQLLLRIWGCRPLRDTDILTAFTIRIQSIQQKKQKIPTLLKWPRARAPFYNALSLGVWPGSQKIIISEDLLLHHSRIEIIAILGHEAGHIIKQHGLHLLLLVFSLAIIFDKLWLFIDNNPDLTNTTLFLAYASIALCASAGLYLFIRLSYLSEYQADTYGALFSSPQVMQQALRKLIQLSHTDPKKSGFRHPSIQSRIDFLEQQTLDPGLVFWQDRRIRQLNLTLYFLSFVLISWYFI